MGFMVLIVGHNGLTTGAVSLHLCELQALSQRLSTVVNVYRACLVSTPQRLLFLLYIVRVFHSREGDWTMATKIMCVNYNRHLAIVCSYFACNV